LIYTITYANITIDTLSIAKVGKRLPDEIVIAGNTFLARQSKSCIVTIEFIKYLDDARFYSKPIKKLLRDLSKGNMF
jgi:hypothetical protein